MDRDDRFLAAWVAAVAILVSVTCLAAWCQRQAPICHSDARWPCPTEVKP